MDLCQHKNSFTLYSFLNIKLIFGMVVAENDSQHILREQHVQYLLSKTLAITIYVNLVILFDKNLIKFFRDLK